MSIVKKIILWIVLAMVGVFVFMWIELSTDINRQFTASKAFETTVLYLKRDSILIQKVGRIIQVDSSSVGGYLTPKKSARLVFDIIAETEEITVTSELTYNSGLWIINNIEYD